MTKNNFTNPKFYFSSNADNKSKFGKGNLTVGKLWNVNRKIKGNLLQLNKLTLDCRKESVNFDLVTPSYQTFIPIPITDSYSSSFLMLMSTILYKFTTYETNEAD